MKTSTTILESLSALEKVATTGDVRQVIANSMLAMVRGELSDAKLLSLAKAGDTVANLLNAEVKVARAKIDLRNVGADLGSISHLGQMLIGNDPKGS